MSVCLSVCLTKMELMVSSLEDHSLGSTQLSGQASLGPPSLWQGCLAKLSSILVFLFGHSR